METLKTDGKFYTYMTGDSGKYSPELKEKIEEIGDMCLTKLANDDTSPIMMLGSIQSGKTRAFIGLMSLCFDNGFDIAIILTKCSTALVQQTVTRMKSEFAGLKDENSTAGDVEAQDILDISFSKGQTEEDKESAVRSFLEKYPGRKRIIIVKKQGDNVDRVNMLVRNMVASGDYKRIMIVDDEADITTIGYEGSSAKKKNGDEHCPELNLRRISGAINAARKQLNKNDIGHVLMQVTATPYALYLQPEVFTIDDIMPIKPSSTVVLPTGKGYIGAKYYFVDSTDPSSEYYPKAKYLPYFVEQEEMSLLNGSTTHKGKRKKGKINNKSITDGRTLQKENFLNVDGANEDGYKYPLPSFRKWIFDCIVGAAIVQLNEKYRNLYLSAVMHLSTTKNLHEEQVKIVETARKKIKEALENDLNDPVVTKWAQDAYDRLKESVAAYGVLTMPSLSDVMKYIAHRDENGKLRGLIVSIDIKEINSNNDISKMLDVNTGELRLENRLTIFVGGQVIDRGITISNMINFFYGRDPKTLQQDTVMQHCRMFGYRGPELLSVTRLYTTQNIFNRMRGVAEWDASLREQMEKNGSPGIIYMNYGSGVIPCSPEKILASDVRSILPGKRYLPVGFDIKKTAMAQHDTIKYILEDEKIEDQKNYNRKTTAEIDESYCDFISKDVARELLSLSYQALDPDVDEGVCNTFPEMESAFLFATDPDNGCKADKVALLVRKGRKIKKYKTRNGGQVYQDAPEDGNNEGQIAQTLRHKYPVLLLTEQTDKEWGKPFWWPVFYTPINMSVGMYSDYKAKKNVYENIYDNEQRPMEISDFEIVNEVGIDDKIIQNMEKNVEAIKDFHNEEFDFSSELTNTKKRNPYKCCIFVENAPKKGEEEKIKDKFRKAYRYVTELLDEGEIEAAISDKISKYFRWLEAGVFDVDAEELHDELLEDLSKVGKKKIVALYIRKTILSLDDIIPMMYHKLGYFKPLGGCLCEIHLYYDRIVDVAKQPFDIPALLAATLANTMQHAWHFADVLTESGKWMHTRNNFFKQIWTQETVAEYFALQYCKQMDVPGKKAALEMIQSRDVKEFPRDGGYSGALLLDGNAEAFNTLYKMSLTDIPAAFDKNLKVFVSKK